MGLFGWAGELLGKKKAASDYLISGLEALEADDKDKAEKELAKAIELAEEEKDYDTLGDACLTLGKLHFEQAEKIRAEERLRRAIQVFDDSEDKPKMIESFNAISEVYISMHRLVDAEQTLRYSIGINQEIHGPESANVANAADRLGDVYMMRKAYPEAENLFSHSLGIHQKIADVTGSDIAAALLKLGTCMAEQEKFDEAQKVLATAAELLERRRKELDREDGITLSATYHELGRVYMQQGKNDKACEQFKKGMEACDEFPGYLGEGDLVEDNRRCQQ